MRPIKVAIVLYRDDATAGGALRVGEAIANNVDPTKVAAHLVFAYGEPGIVTEKARVPVHHLHARSSKDLPHWLAVRALFKKIKPDIIHFVDGVNWVALATLGLNAKHLLHFHGRPITSLISFFDKSMMRTRCHLSDGFVGITQGATHAAIEAGFAKPDRAWTVYNGVDVEALENLPPKEDARRVLELPTSAKLIGQVARLVKHNGGAELLDVLPLLPEDWHAVFVGDGPFRTELKQMVHERNLGKRVHFTGVLQDVRPAYAALDAVLLLARYQPFCLMLAEAMAAGVVVFGLMGEGEYAESANPLIKADNSVFIPRSNPTDHESVEAPEVFRQLADKIIEFGQHPEHFSRMLENARNHVRVGFGTSKQADVITKVYSRMMSLPK